MNMLLLLKCRKKMKIDELAEALEVAPRQIRRYRDDLEQAGFAIFSSPGPDGGYRLYSPLNHLPCAITKEEFETMEKLGKELEKNLPHYKKEFKSVMTKLEYFRCFPEGGSKTGIVRESEPFDTFFVKRTSAKMDIDKERKKLDDFQRAAIAKHKIKMTYTSNTSGRSTRIVQPYALIEHEGGIYLIAHCEKRDQKMYFKLVRVEDYEVLKEKFQRDRAFDLEQHVKKCFGIFEGKEMKIAVKIKPPFIQPTKERIIAPGQTITDLPEENAILLEATTQGMEAVCTWILGMGVSAEVIEPLELKEAVRRKLGEVISLYDR
jgi:predicted DNA-binding transcriptional regulator YafY